MADSGVPVLIVEDERIVARALPRTLLGFGYDAFAIAASREEALACAAEKIPAVVLMDIGIEGELEQLEADVRLEPCAGTRFVITFAEK